MGAQHSYLQNLDVVDSGHGLVYFQDLFSLAGPGGLKFSTLQNQNSIEATAAAGANAAVMAATGNLQDLFSLAGPGGLKFSTLQNLPSVQGGQDGLGYQTMGYLQNLPKKVSGD